MILLDFQALVQRFAAQARAATTTALDFTVGSLFRAIAEANAALALWLQWLVLDVLRQTRGATSIGTELDTWVGDFGVTRLPAVGAVGALTFSRNTTGLASFIPVGSQAKSTDGTQLFSVTADPTNSAYSLAQGGYNVAANVASVTVAARALSAGAATNVLSGTVTVLASGIAGIDAVTNALAFTGGLDAENDTALRARFALYIQGLSKGTAAAIAYAITSVQQGLTYAIAQNVDTVGGYRPSNFVVTVDDGSGAPSTTLLNAVYTAIDAVRSIGETFSVRAPSIITVSVSMTITAAPGYSKPLLQGPVAAAVTAYIAGLSIGQSLLYTRLAQVAYDATPGIGTVTGLVINGAQADVAAGVSGVIKVSTVAVN